ncbi:unnamed protein product [Candidula unifasciata]|uniref:Peptidase M13 C-terminal domain-containing protein n=1 Tax=Candidula unifasciata TaxID=100452 RepID=A0A8S3ZUD1_9EUPU|nr:unnamed protein product [Candidula unifasciata]
MFCFKETRISSQTTLERRYSPDEFRVNGALQNLEEFATTFRCAPGTRMNPVNKCRVYF